MATGSGNARPPSAGTSRPPDERPQAARETASPVFDDPDTVRIPLERSVPTPSETPGTGARPWWRPGTRAGLLAAVALGQAVVIVAATMWLTTRSDAAEPLGMSTPATLTGLVSNTGEAELNLRNAPEVAEGNTSRTVSAGEQLSIVCGQVGDSVSSEFGRTGVWLRTVDNLYVSQLYVSMPGQTHVPRCPEPDILLVEIPALPTSSSEASASTEPEPSANAPAATAESSKSPLQARPEARDGTGDAPSRAGTAPRSPVALGSEEGMRSEDKTVPKLGDVRRQEEDRDEASTSTRTSQEKRRVG